MSETLLIERAGGVLRIVLNRPDVRNAMNSAMIHALIAAFEEAADDGAVRAISITGAGSDFSSGGDMKDIDAAIAGTPEDRAATFRKLVREDSMRLFVAMYRLPQPVVVGVRGHVIGAGFQMAALADLVVASDTAKFVIPQVKLAHTVDHGESWALPRKIGMGRAMQLCLLGETVDAASAEKFGLANWVVADGELEIRTHAIAEQIAASPALAVRGMKALLRTSEANSFEDQFEQEHAMIGQMVASDDFVEAVSAFAERRPPVFAGR